MICNYIEMHYFLCNVVFFSSRKTCNKILTRPCPLSYWFIYLFIEIWVIVESAKKDGLIFFGLFTKKNVSILKLIPMVTFQWLLGWVNNCWLTPSEQFVFNHILARTSYISMRWWCWAVCSSPTRIGRCILIVLAHWNNKGRRGRDRIVVCL